MSGVAMKTFYIFLVFLIQANFGFEQELEDDQETEIDTDSIIATNHQLVLRSTDGKIKMGTDSGSHYRAEIKDANNEAKGIYSWIDPLGNAHTTAFNAGQNGYQVLPVPKSGLVLPPFPYGLYQARPQEAQARIKVESKPEPALYRPPSSPSTYQDDDDVVVIGPDPEPKPEPESPLGDDLLGGFQIQPGTPVAASRPTATAVAGEKGTAQVQPQSQASVGPGGVAIAFPTASAGVGPGGVAVARPVAVSSAGDGGIAIAGGTSTAFAGLDGSSTQHVLFNNQAVLPQNGIVMIPIVANYYFNNQNSEQKKDEAQTPMFYSARPRSAINPMTQPLFYKKEAKSDQKLEYSASSMEQLKNV